MKDWSRNDKFAFAGVVIGVLGIVIAVVQSFGSRSEPVNVTYTKTVTTPKPPPTPEPKESTQEPDTPKRSGILVNVPGSRNNITLLPGRNDKAQSGDLNIIGVANNQTVYLAPGQLAEVNVPGTYNTIRIARSLSKRVSYASQGQNNSQEIIDDPK